MKVPFCLSFFYAALLTTALAVIAKYPAGNETLSVLLLYSTDPSYSSFSSALRNWVDDAFKRANENGSYYQLELVPQDTQVMNRSLSQQHCYDYMSTSLYIAIYSIDQYVFVL